MFGNVLSLCRGFATAARLARHFVYFPGEAESRNGNLPFPSKVAAIAAPFSPGFGPFHCPVVGDRYHRPVGVRSRQRPVSQICLSVTKVIVTLSSLTFAQ